jgi:hypothetical protein
MNRPDSTKVPRATEADDDTHRRTVGRRLAPDLALRLRSTGEAAGPTSEEIERSADTHRRSNPSSHSR